LTSLFENTGIPAVPAIDAQPPKKRSWLPLLTVLFLISYGLMTMLIVEQGATIESQRALIRELFRDSTELSSMKVKAQQEARLANSEAKTQAPSSQIQAPSTQTPSTQVPLTQAPSKQAPSSQAAPQNRALNQTDKRQHQIQPPSRPASDMADARRELRTI
jgi:cytoskeletal protein RodZ